MNKEVKRATRGSYDFLRAHLNGCDESVGRNIYKESHSDEDLGGSEKCMIGY